MRKHLQQRDGRRGSFTATFQRFGSKPAWKGPNIVTLLFVDVRDSTDNSVADHLWFQTALCWQRADLQPGDLVQFDARVRAYLKGYEGDGEGRTKDYKLSFPNNVVVLSRAGLGLTAELPLFAL